MESVDSKYSRVAMALLHEEDDHTTKIKEGTRRKGQINCGT